ncbi:MAG: hypothetical protein J1D88_08125 [Treponema sp.]|nr:hypothetical protein [Treponema sp.]
MEAATMTPAAQVIISLIPIVGIAFGSILVFFALLWRHHENKLRILKGTYSHVHFNSKMFSLLTGLLLEGVGLVLTVMFILLEGVSWNILGGLLPLVSGMMFLIFYKVNPGIKTESGDET